ncbi:MAG: serine/threonine protein kinase [Deltaproteobacteria bacterium]|nr:serine/threonine protein kinase [Deltaproteobacteria bacterium]MCB9786416.1 serine/threonine protein kinase [Deltaproteobacteria bacterium]
MLDRIEKYRVLEEIGQGGMSVVYRGHDDALDRDVAIKVLHRHLSRDPEARERFSREAKAVARLTHHNIPEIYDYSSNDGDLNYLVTELITGAPLSALLREGPPLMPEIGAMLAVGVANALEHAHAHQIIHRDVKPENILVGLDGVVKLTDFGIAQVVGLESMTITGTLVGSPAHMSPEQIEGNVELDFRADIWALGTVLYATATAGALPFEAPTPHGILKRIVEGRYEDPRRINPHVDSALAAIIGRCLRVERDARYASVGEVAAELVRWLAVRELHDPEAELARWMADREGYQAALGRQVVAAMLAVGSTALATGRRHAALEAYGRVLNLDPDHDEALRKVRELTSGMRLRRALRLVGAFGGAALAVAMLWQVWPRPAPQPEPVVVSGRALSPMEAPLRAPRLEPNPKPMTAPFRAGRQVGRVLGRLGRRVARLSDPESVVVASAPEPEVPVDPGYPVRVTVNAAAVDISIDGHEVKAGATVRLSSGPHVATLKHPQSSGGPQNVSFTVAERPEGQLQEQRLVYRFDDAKVLIVCDGDGKVYLSDQLLGPCGTTYDVPVVDSEPKKRPIEVRWEDGRDVWRRGVTIRPGAQVRIHAE